MCDMQFDLILAPLPAKQHLWEASDEFMWKAESEKEFGVHSEFGLTASGELVRLEKGRPYCKDAVLLDKSSEVSRAAQWEEWCSGIDGIGGLVMLAASLMGH